MTEGPEATHLGKFISRHFKGKRLSKISIVGGRYKHHGAPARMKEFQQQFPATLTDVYKKGKMLLLIFNNGWFIIAKMGMTGWFARPEDEQLFESPPNIIFQFGEGARAKQLQWHDFRNFGTLTFTNNSTEVLEELKGIAPDILDSDVTAAQVYKRILAAAELDIRWNPTIAEALMDQAYAISGIGNIIKSELLYDAGISPKRHIKDLSKQDWFAVFRSARKISQMVLRHLESGKGREDYFSAHKIYQKETDPNGRPVKRAQFGDGRTTFWVPEVQH
jgi:formamidopyrimidine-DNA glycosylase